MALLHGCIPCQLEAQLFMWIMLFVPMAMLFVRQGWSKIKTWLGK